MIYYHCYYHNSTNSNTEGALHHILKELEILSEEFQERLCTFTRPNITFTAVRINKSMKYKSWERLNE
jgi:hypothetical protein